MLILVAGTWHQAAYWKDSRTLFEHTPAITDRNYIMRNNLGVVVARQSDVKVLSASTTRRSRSTRSTPRRTRIWATNLCLSASSRQPGHTLRRRSV